MYEKDSIKPDEKLITHFFDLMKLTTSISITGKKLNAITRSEYFSANIRRWNYNVNDLLGIQKLENP